jgi:2-polyprenyl-3-methyl-5-hydroxy-6-metoxy-1,4-benzoquinol methylase
MTIKKCPLCSSNKIIFYIKDFKNHEFQKCENCDLVFDDDKEKFDYQDDECWFNTLDPDGKKRDLTKDKDFKIKNWYGDIFSFIDKYRNGKIMDIGCGLGYLLSNISPKWEKHGFEISKFATSFIKKEFPEIQLVDNLLLNEREPPKELQEYFDIVTCYHVIEHIKNPNQFFKNLSMLVKPKGILIVGTPNIDSFTANRFKGNFRLLGDNGHVCLFNPKNLGNLFKKNNFSIKNIEFPFFKTKYFTIKNLLRLINTKKISPPFYGNIMTIYGKKH